MKIIMKVKMNVLRSVPTKVSFRSTFLPNSYYFYYFNQNGLSEQSKDFYKKVLLLQNG